MFIIQIIPAFYGYGGDRLVTDMHLHFLREGANSQIVCFAGKCPQDIPFCSTLGLHKAYDIKAIFRLRKKLNELLTKNCLKSSLLHVHLTPCQLYAPISVRMMRFRLPMLTTEHSTNTKRRSMWSGKMLDRRIYKPFRQIVCISEGVKRVLLLWLPELEKKLITIPNGINLERFSVFGKSGRDSGCPVIVSVGRLKRMKNYDTAIKACVLMKDLEFEYHIIGAGEDEAFLRNLIEREGLEKKVKLLGFRSDVPLILQQCDIFLMPSRWEGFGLALVEAMASRLPVVASNVPGVREIVCTGPKGGFLIDPNDAADIAEKLRTLIIDEKLRKEMGKNNHLYARKYSIESTAKSYLKLYEDVFNNGACSV